MRFRRGGTDLRSSDLVGERFTILPFEHNDRCNTARDKGCQRTQPDTQERHSGTDAAEKAVFCLLALQHGFVPRQLNWSTPDPSCVIPQAEPLQKDLRHILSNAFGFGGNDSSIILSAYDA